MISIKSHLSRIALIILLMAFKAVAANDIPIIDAHSQFDHKVKIEKMIMLMDEAGVSKTILSTRGKVAPSQLLDFAKKHEGRIIPAVRTKGGPHEDESPKYYKILKNQLNMRELVQWLK